MTQLSDLWKNNVDQWKKQKDFKTIIEAKDNQKNRLSWPVTLHNAMLRYNEYIDSFDNSSTANEAVGIIDEGTKLELQMKELTHRVATEGWPVDADGLVVLKRYIEWRKNLEQLKFELGE